MGMLSKAVEMGIFIHRGPILGNIEGCSFPRTLRKGRNFYIRRTFIGEFKRHVKEGSGNGHLCP